MGYKSLQRIDRMHHLYATLSSISKSDLLSAQSSLKRLQTELDELLDWIDSQNYRDLAESLRFKRISNIHHEMQHLVRLIHVAQERHSLNERTAEVLENRKRLLLRTKVREEEEGFLNDLVSIKFNLGN